MGKLPLFDLLVRERLDNSDPRKRIFNLRIDIADPILASPQRRLHFLIEMNCIDSHEEQEEQNDQGKLDVDIDQDNKRADEIKQ